MLLYKVRSLPRRNENVSGSSSHCPNANRSEAYLEGMKTALYLPLLLRLCIPSEAYLEGMKTTLGKGSPHRI